MRKPSIGRGCGLVVALLVVVLIFPYYCYHWAPGSNSTPVRSPDGKYLAYTNIKGFVDQHNVTLWLTDAKGDRREICSGVYVGEIKWSPDSKRVAILLPVREDSPMIWYSIVDIASMHRVSDVADMNVGWSYDPKPSVGWGWANPNKLVVYADYDKLDEKGETTVRRTAAVLSIRDTAQELIVSGKPESAPSQ